MPGPKRDPSVAYRGWRSAAGPRVVRADGEGSERVLVPHPASGLPGAGFEWGVDAPGADQLSFAILADAFGEAEAASLYTDFKFDVVADLDDQWRFTVGEIADWLGGYLDPWEA